MHQSALINRFSAMASLKLTFAAMLMLAAVVLVSYFEERVSRGWMVVPLILLAINLLAALTCNPKLRRQPGLALFHIALLLLCALAGAGTVTGLQGRIELAQGQAFSAQDVHIVEQGIGHPGGLRDLAFTQGLIEVDFAPGLVRQKAHVQVRTDGEELVNGTHDLTDDKALEIAGYRFSLTPNKGFAPIFEWTGDDGGELAGAVHLPSYPAVEWKQEQRWMSPSGEEIVVALIPLQRPPRDRAWTLQSQLDGAVVEIRAASGTTKLQPGEAVKLRGGALRLREIGLWMGYRVDYQPFLPWMLWIALMGVCGMAWHVIRRFWGTSDEIATEMRGAASTRDITAHV